MAVSLGSNGVPTTVTNGAPGNVLVLAGQGLTGGGPASVVLGNQGVVDPPGFPAHTTVTLPSSFEGTQIQIGPLPDGITDGTLTITASDSTTATCGLRVRSQYVQACEYGGDGVDTSSLPPGMLDMVLRRASALCDAYMGQGIRLLQIMEQPKYVPPRQEMAPRLYPWRVRGRRVPILSADQLNFVSAPELITTFNITDCYVNQDLDYIEILAYAIGNYALLGELETIGYSANVFHLTYTSGYGVLPGSYTNTSGTFDFNGYPQDVCEAAAIVTTRLLQRYNLNAMNMGEMKSFEDKATFESRFEFPVEAGMLLRPYVARTIA